MCYATHNHAAWFTTGVDVDGMQNAGDAHRGARSG